MPRTPWGAPDLQGNWSFATVTPLERPASVTKPFLSAQEIADIERRAIVAATDEARGADAQRDVAGAYNDFWWDRGTRVAGRRTSLIVNPEDGHLPPLTPEAKRWAESPEARQIGAVNTVTIDKNGRTAGYNTDRIGFLRAFEAAARHLRFT